MAMTEALITVEYNEVIPVTHDQMPYSEMKWDRVFGEPMNSEDIWYCQPCEEDFVGKKNIVGDQELCGNCYEDILRSREGKDVVFCDLHNLWVRSDPCDAGTGGYVCEACHEHLTAKWK